MSNTLRVYKSIPPAPYDNSTPKDLYLTATVQGEEHEAAMQFTIGDQYVLLSGKQLEDLIDIVKKRLAYEPGYSATDSLGEETILPSGEVLAQ